MLLFCPSEDQDVIQIDHHDAFHNEVVEDVVYHGLEGSWTVGHPKKHYWGLEHALVGSEDYLPLVSRLDADIVETPTDI